MVDLSKFHSAKTLDLLNPAVLNDSENISINFLMAVMPFQEQSSSQYCRSTQLVEKIISFSAN